jgi:hypothetical protein
MQDQAELIQLPAANNYPANLDQLITLCQMVLDKRIESNKLRNNVIVIDRMDEEVVKKRLVRTFDN